MDDQLNTNQSNDLPAAQNASIPQIVADDASGASLPTPGSQNPAAGQSVPNTPQVPILGDKHSVDSPAVAEDVDLIEKEWVNKAKEIVAKTKNDPSQQNIELSRFKADYLKTRFSKDIKPMDS